MAFAVSQLCAHAYEHGDVVNLQRSDNFHSMLVRRDAAMVSLIAHGQTLITLLTMLTQIEKEAVLALVVIGRSLAGYARAVHPDPEVIDCFKRILEVLSLESAPRVLLRSHPCSCHTQVATDVHDVMSGRSNSSEPGTAAETDEIAFHTLHLKALYAALAPSVQILDKARGVAELADSKWLSERTNDRSDGA